MKKFRRIMGIILMAFNGIGVFSTVSTAGGFIREGKVAPLIILLLFFGALFCLGYRLYTGGKRKNSKKPNAGKVQINEQDAAQLTAGNQAETQTVAQKAAPDSAGIIGEVSAYTAIAAYLELPFHDGDNFFLFEKEEDAAQFIRVSGRKDLSVRSLDSSIIKRELAEYLCCGYTGAVIKKNLSSVSICEEDRRLSAEDLIRDYGLNDLSSVGHIAPTAEKKMHNYLNQMSYTFRKYGNDLSSVPDFWQNHMKQFKDEVIRHLLCANLCLPTQQNDGKTMKFSIMSVSMPSGQKWAALFTDMFAIYRYMHKSPNSIVFPNLLSDVAGSIREGKITGVAGILINPGREEFKMTVDEIAEQEEWLKANPDVRSAYFEKERLPFIAALKKTQEKKDLAGSAIPDNSQTKPTENAAPAAATELYPRISLSVNSQTASVPPGHSFFMGLLPDEKPYSDSDAVDADKNRPNTDGCTNLDRIGSSSRWSEYFYDPKYRRIVIDLFTADEKTGERRYHGRETILPPDLIDRLNQCPEECNPGKTVIIRKIQEIMDQDCFGE